MFHVKHFLYIWLFIFNAIYKIHILLCLKVRLIIQPFVFVILKYKHVYYEG